jgi:hypothetical protein
MVALDVNVDARVAAADDVAGNRDCVGCGV